MNDSEYASALYGRDGEATLKPSADVTQDGPDPAVRYARTSDGVNIAYYSMGSGPPLIYVLPFGHVGMELQYAELRSWCERLAINRRLIRLDRRGTGLSDRDQDSTPELAVLDIEAVARKEGLKRFALMGQAYSAAIAVVYASVHPEKVSQLLLWSPIARSKDYVESSPPVQAALAAATKDWDTFTELFAHQATAWADAEQARRLTVFLRQTGFTADRHFETVVSQGDYDLRERLARLPMPVLVMHRREAAFPTVEVVREVAALAPGSRLVLLEGSAILPFFGDSRAVLDTIDQFLSEPSGRGRDGLTERELEILTLLASGASNESIARSLTISTRTVERHIGNIYRKIDAKNRAEATAYAFRNGIQTR